MGLSGGSKSTSGSAQKWATPYAQQGAQSIQSVFNANQGGLQNLTDTVQGTVPGLSSMFSSWQPVNEQSRGYYSDVLSGKYLDPSNNTALQGVIDRMNRDVTSNVNSQFAGAGRYGSAAHSDVLSRNLAEQESAILANEYGRERAAMDSAAGAVPQITASQLQQLLQAAGVGAELPYTGTNNMASGLSALFSGGTQKQGGGFLNSLLSAGAQVGSAALMASDRRLKSNIVKIGEEPDGLGVYEYDIFGDRTRGVMADEVETLRPWALGPVISGYKTVRYDRL